MHVRSQLSAAALMFAGALVFVACSKQGEGERCELENGYDDCEAPLICKSVAGLNGQICCPQDPASASVAECRNASSETDAGAPTDTSPAADSGSAADTGSASDASPASDADSAGG
jgi:hypothetical protein